MTGSAKQSSALIKMVLDAFLKMLDCFVALSSQ
jgi:hypothetical protein